MEIATDDQIISVIKESFSTLEEFRDFIKYAKLSKAYAEARASVTLKRKEIDQAEIDNNAELSARKTEENIALEALNEHIEKQTRAMDIESL